jgi:uncharacterized protein (TIGR02118 family)
MIKLVALMNRKPGMTMAEFKEYYEQRHAPLIKELLPFATDYRRNFVVEGQPYRPAHSMPDRPTAPVFDVMTELTFESQEMLQKMLDTLADPAIGKRIAEDEANFLDRTTMRSCLVDERM